MNIIPIQYPRSDGATKTQNAKRILFLNVHNLVYSPQYSQTAIFNKIIFQMLRSIFQMAQAKVLHTLQGAAKNSILYNLLCFKYTATTSTRAGGFGRFFRRRSLPFR
jgi:hypothetical protein